MGSSLWKWGITVLVILLVVAIANSWSVTRKLVTPDAPRF